MPNVLFMFALGLVILLFSTQRLVQLAEKVSRVLGISPLVVGLTLVAAGTSFPELAVSITAMLRQDGGLALGNIVGSNIVNILLVFPVGILVSDLRIGTTKTQTNVGILLGTTAIFVGLRFLGLSHPLVGLALISLSFLIGLVEYKLGVDGRGLEDKKWFKTIKKERIRTLDLILGVVLIGSIIAGSSILVEAVEKISLLTNVSTTILGLTITAIATSLPELLTTVFSQNRHQEKITVGNIIGSNIYNLMFIGGIIMLFPTKTVISLAQWWWLIGSTIIFYLVVTTFSGRKPTKIIALFMSALLIIYLYTQRL